MEKSIAYKLSRIRERFDNIGDTVGVLMCDNLADDLDVNIKYTKINNDIEESGDDGH